MDPIINKLRIIALRNPKDQLTAGGGFSVGNLATFVLDTAVSRIFEVQINPENIVRKFGIKHHEPKEPGADGSETQFDSLCAQDLELKFIIDGTNTVQQNGIPAIDPVSLALNALPGDAQQYTYVPLKIAQLKATVYEFIDESHRPPFTLINYGTLIFFGVLKDMSINYQLFNPAGIPIRAEVTLKVKEHKPFKDRASLLSLLSPDLTRHHTVKASENILGITGEVYEDQHYYLEVAKANELTNFRKLNAGQNLLLPPIDKTATT